MTQYLSIGFFMRFFSMSVMDITFNICLCLSPSPSTSLTSTDYLATFDCFKLNWTKYYACQTSVSSVSDYLLVFCKLVLID